MAKQLTRLQKRKKLEALFDRGGYVRFNRDADGRPLINPEPSDTDMLIWVGPPSPFQREMAVREAQAHRARVMLEARDDADSAAWVTIRSFIRSLNIDGLVDYILELDDQDFYTQARRDILQQKEWEDVNALRDAIRQYEEAGSPQGDPEWEPVLQRDREFTRQVIERAEELRDDARAGYLHMPRAELETKASEKRVEQAGSAAFMTSYEEWMMFYACRDDEDHSELYFESKDDVKKLPLTVQGALAEKLGEFIADAGEAKN